MEKNEARIIPEFPDYHIDMFGNVYRNGRAISPSYDAKGAMSVNICDMEGKRKVKKVAYLLLQAFDNEEHYGKIPCYRDGNTSNISLDNLYWGTKAESMQNTYIRALASGDYTDGRVARIGDRSNPVYSVDENYEIIKTYGSTYEAAKDIDVPVDIIINATRSGKTLCHTKWLMAYQYDNLNGKSERNR